MLCAPGDKLAKPSGDKRQNAKMTTSEKDKQKYDTFIMT
jgi:hypothetical protein